jgi:outer membrane protein assembly factor BamB
MFAHRLCIGEDAFAYVYSKTVKDQYESYLKVVDLRTGKDKWQAKLNSSLLGGPQMIGDALIFQLQNKVSAVSLDGRKKRWELELKSSSFGSEYKIFDNYLLVSEHNDRLHCVDLKQHKILWQEKMPVRADTLKIAGARLYLQGSVEAGTYEVEPVKLSPRYDQLKDLDIMKNLTAKTGPRTKYVGVLICLDLPTGKELWRQEKVCGEIVVDSKRLVIVTDTAMTSKMNLSNQGKGFTIIRQFSPEDGTELVNRKSPLGLAEPYLLVGNKLIGIDYERVNAGMYGLTAGKTHYAGLAAFNLK